MERNFALFENFFSFAGFHLDKDTVYGVISLTSEFESSRTQLDKLTTLMIYALRLIYEEGREDLQLITEVFTTVGGLVEKLLTLGAISKKPANLQLSRSLRQLQRFNLIRKVDGKWEDAETRILILPSILFVVSKEQIQELNDALKHSVFGTDRYRFTISPRAEYRDYYNMITDPMLMDTGGWNIASANFNQKYQGEYR